MTQRLGDAPIEAKYREQMNMVAQMLDRVFNGKDANPHLFLKEDKRKVGFVLLVFPFGNCSLYPRKPAVPLQLHLPRLRSQGLCHAVQGDDR
jgi:hypothetical protein